ncbi:hypothetical protein ACN9MY_01800 [Pseudoduganella sp. R-31]|uniref:hypothetical protein n=1 Tax=Pseudoduganella sp. R-31 TaxID=3404060 RepID=UPI003CFA5B38
MQETAQPVDRETLYNEVWLEPVTVVAERYGLSDVGLAKICRAWAIPLPSRGYWAKVNAGRIMRQVPLPPLEQPIRRFANLVKIHPEQLAARKAAKEEHARIREEVLAIPLEEAAASPEHPLVRAASKRLRKRDGWPADTLIRSAPKEVLNIAVTRSALDRALLFIDSLLKAMAKQGFEVEIDEERGASIVRRVKTDTKLDFTLVEHIRRTRHEATPAEERAQKRYWERSRWDGNSTFPHIPMYDYAPTGLLTFQVGRWPQRTWNDTPNRSLEQRLGEVVAGIVVLAQETFAKEQEEIRRQEALRRAQARYEFLMKRRAAEATRFKSLESDATNWERAVKLRAFADALERNALAAGILSEEAANWLAWTRAKADWLDPFILVSDPILDAPEPKRPLY